ncbi:hypothetical protein AXX17_AT5G30550 [Arabidopsis thaliana]|uniref:Uncharacterized protein n=1 Tax=Arabidopsis thaliana TaxID=3702 RepID=A0A178UP41_ARATH|nr:hypothetical protein AXX17_AT5G30550 [Arabidopsis thaliana]
MHQPSSQTPYSTPSGPAGQFMAHQGHGMPPSHGPQRTQSRPVTLQGNNNVMGDMFLIAVVEICCIHITHRSHITSSV